MRSSTSGKLGKENARGPALQRAPTTALPVGFPSCCSRRAQRGVATLREAVALRVLETAASPSSLSRQNVNEVSRVSSGPATSTMASVASRGWPGPGHAFLDWCIGKGAVLTGSTESNVTYASSGDKLLHLACGRGGLIQMQAQHVMQALGFDTEPTTASRRASLPFAGKPLSTGSLRFVASFAPFDVVLLQDQPSPLAAHQSWWCSPEALNEVMSVTHEGSRICVEVPLVSKVNPANIINTMHNMGLVVVEWQQAQLPTTPTPALRLIAVRA